MEREMADEFKAQAVFRMLESRTRLLQCLGELSDAEVWRRPNSKSNSVGNLVLHLTGNITQWILSAMDGYKDDRDRDSEFSAEGGIPASVLTERLAGTIDKAIGAIGKTGPEGLLRKRSVQGFEYTGIGIILHVVEHLSYHTGQIAFWTKSLKDKDLEFYRGVDLNTKNA